MGNLSEFKYIVHAALILTFSDLACLDAGKANEIMQRFPEYRGVKDQAHHGFWMGDGVKMLADVKSALVEAEKKGLYDVNECA